MTLLRENREYDQVIPIFSLDEKFRSAALKALGETRVEMILVDYMLDMSKLFTETYLPTK